MKSFIAPIYFQTNSISSEKLTGGLLLCSGKKNWLAFSEEKIAMAGKLGGLDLKKLLEHTLELFKNKVKSTNEALGKKGELFETKQVLTEQYLLYLSKYSKGVIQFASPKPILIDPSQAEFQKLFELYVGESLSTKYKKSTTSTFHAALKSTLNVQGLKEKADIDFIIKPEHIKGVLQPAQITLITKNGSLEVVQAIDFHNSVPTVVDHIYEFEAVVSNLKKFEAQKDLPQGKYKIVVSTPEHGTAQEKLFNNFFESTKDTFNIIEPHELTEIVSNILSSPHIKFSEFLNKEKS